MIHRKMIYHRSLFEQQCMFSLQSVDFGFELTALTCRLEHAPLSKTLKRCDQTFH